MGLEIKNVNGTPILGFKRLNRKTERGLIDSLRRCLLFQQPRPEFENQSDKHPKFVHVKLPFNEWKNIMKIIGEAGGWTLPKAAREKLEAEQQALSDREAKIVGTKIKCPGENCANIMAVIVDLFRVECVGCGQTYRSETPLDGGPV